MFRIPKGYEQDLCILKGTTDSLLQRYENDDTEVDYDTMEAIGKLNTMLRKNYFEE